MKFNINYFQKTVLHIALKNGDIEVIKLLLSHKDLNINVPYVFDFNLNIMFIYIIQIKFIIIELISKPYIFLNDIFKPII